MTKLEHVPNGLPAITDWYGGQPAHVVSSHGKVQIVADEEWYRENMKRVYVPFPLRLSWAPSKCIKRPAVHKKIADALVDALQEIMDYGGHDFLVKYDLDICGGIYACRTQRGAKQLLSTHAWGIAIDYCPVLGPYDEPGRMPHFIVDAFVKRGFTNPKRDQMHFQGACDY